MRSLLGSRRAALLAPMAAALVLVATAACSDSSTSPNPVATATKQADRFDDIADSLYNEGYSDEGDFAQAMADLIRVAGRVDNVVVKVDGRSVRHNAMLFETLVPESACAGSSDPASCLEDNPAFAQIVIGWTGSDLKESFFAGSTETGTSSADYNGFDIPPAEVYYAVRNVNGSNVDLFGAPAQAWDSYAGSLTTSTATRGAACTLPNSWQAGTSITCNLAYVSPSFDVTSNESAGETTDGSHRITMASQRVDGVSSTVTEAFDPYTPLGVARPSAQRLQRLQRLQRARAARALLARVVPKFQRAPVPR